ncbi:hypothetical protein DFH06DRAFT_974629 [Mycena polygramma]|nr:hypothetical protein DFH06DRAFT_974629 [Mycena polygramma]
MFTRLHITSKLHDYSKFDSTPRDIRVSLNVLPDTVDGIDFCISINPPEECPAGYLFLCPPKELQIGPSSYRWPACAAYWTRDPSGIERFSTEEAAQLGFPAIALKTNLLAYSWDSSVYAGLRKFHRGKGFDPDSEDVARHLGYPLYQLTGEVDAPFACGESIFVG